MTKLLIIKLLAMNFLSKDEVYFSLKSFTVSVKIKNKKKAIAVMVTLRPVCHSDGEATQTFTMQATKYSQQLKKLFVSVDKI